MEKFDEENGNLERIESKVGLEKQDELPLLRAGFQIMAFWLAVLAITGAGWYLVFARVIPFIVRCFHH